MGDVIKVIDFRKLGARYRLKKMVASGRVLLPKPELPKPRRDRVSDLIDALAYTFHECRNNRIR